MSANRPPKRNNNLNREQIQFKEKEYVYRNTVLTDLYKSDTNVQAVHHGFVAILVGQFLHSAATDILYKGRINLGVDLIQRSFSNVHWIVAIWLCMFAWTVSVYFGFKIWATARTKFVPKSSSVKTWDKLWITMLIVYYIGFLYFTAVAVAVCQLRPAARFGFTCETLRMLMKAHAFIRANVPGVLRECDENGCPEFGKFLYFLWAPTLLYREVYPRTTSIRWNFVANKLLQLVAIVFFLSFLFEKYIIDVFKDYGRKPFVLKDTIVIVFANAPCGMALLLGLFYTIQHTWMEGCAEVLTFGDRLFYENWWTVTCFKDYYRKWNVLVQEWIYVHLYMDLYVIFSEKNRFLINYVIFFVSAIAHEYITAVTFGFFLPILFVQFFCVGVPLSHLKFSSETLGRVIFFYFLALGMSMQSAFFAIEYFYRVNCPGESDAWRSYLIPRFLTCSV